MRFGCNSMQLFDIVYTGWVIYMSIYIYIMYAYIYIHTYVYYDD